MVKLVEQKLQGSNSLSKQLPKDLSAPVATEMTAGSKNKGIGQYFRPPPQSSPAADIWKASDRFASEPICPCNRCANSQNNKSPSHASQLKPHRPSSKPAREGLVVNLKSLKIVTAFKHLGLLWTRQNLENASTSELPLNNEWKENYLRETDRISQCTDGQNQPAVKGRSNARRASRCLDASLKTDQFKVAITWPDNNIIEAEQEMGGCTSSSSSTDDGSDIDYDPMALAMSHSHF